MVHFRLKKRLKGSSSYHFGEGNGNPLQCSCLENPREGGAWWAAVYGVTQSWTRLKQLSSSYHLSRKSSREDHHIAMTLDKGNTIVFHDCDLWATKRSIFKWYIFYYLYSLRDLVKGELKLQS